VDRRRKGWTVAISLLVVTGGALLTLLLQQNTPDRRLRTAWSELRRRPTEGRLATLTYVPRPIARGSDVVDPATLRLFAVAQETAARCTGAGDNPDCAIASLLSGASEKAIAQLRERVARRRDDGPGWNDLACAYLQHGLHTHDGSEFARALAAADTALDDQPGFAPALFNRARALDHLQLGEAATAAYTQFLTIEPGGGWSDEARQRLRALSNAPSRERWQQALPRLRRAAMRRDGVEVGAIVAAYPQESRAWGETEFLGDWATAFESGDTSAAAEYLQLTSMTADALRARNGDAMLQDSVVTIEKADRPERVRALARGHRAYREARRAYAQRKVADATNRFEEVSRSLRAASSPLAATADYFRANALLDLNRADESIAECERLQRETPLQYRALRAQLLWLSATARGSKGLLYDALNDYERALGEFMALGETDNAQFMRAGVAWCNDFLGREREAWRAQLELCRILTATGNARTLQAALNAAADSQMRREQWAVARSLYRVAAQLAPRAENPRAAARTLVWLALAAMRSEAPSAPSDVVAARAAAASLSDKTLRNDAAADLTTAEATSIYRTRPADAIRILGIPIAHAKQNGLGFQLAPLYIIRARANALLGKTAEAIRDYDEATARIESRRDSIGAVDLRDSYFGINESVYREEIDLLDRAGLFDRAMLVAERQRLWSDRQPTQDSTRAEDVPSLAAKVPAGAVVAHYIALDDRLVIYIPGRRGAERWTANVTRAGLAKLANELLSAASEDDLPRAHTAGAALYGALIAPIEPLLRGKEQLAVAGDALIARIPFAALYDARSGRYFIDRMSVVYSRSAAAFVQDAPNQAPVAQRVVVAGDPAFDPARFPDLRRLDGAADEARAIGRLYPRARVLTGEDVTRRRLIPEIQQATIAHIAAHGVVNDQDASLSSLILAGSGSDAGTLSVRELTAMDLSQLRVVVLAGCRTSLPAGGYGDLRSLAAAVHAAGAQNVVGSLWDLEDEASRDLSIAFHRELRRGSSPAAALHEAQVRQMAIRPDRLSAWAGVQLYGHGRM